MAVEVGEGFGVVGNHGVEVEGLRVGEIGIGDGNGDSRPVGAQPTAEAVGVVSGAEVVVSGFSVAFLAFKLIVLRAGVGIGALATIWVEISVITHHTVVLRDHARSAKEILDIIDGIAADGEHGHSLAAEENVFGRGVAGGVRFGEDVATRAIPVELAGDLGHPAAIGIVQIIDSDGRRVAKVASKLYWYGAGGD